MRRILATALTATAIGFASPAMATVTLTNTDGTPLSYQIFGIKSTGNPVFGSSPNNTTVPNVTYTGNVATTMDIKDGFAQIDDSDAKNPSWFEVIVNPDLDFTAMKFAVQLTGDADVDVDVFYLLANSGLDPNAFASYTNQCATCSFSSNNKDDNKHLITGDNNEVFDGIMLKVRSDSDFLFEFKQNSYDPAPAPEPGTWALMLLGFGGIGLALRRNRKRSAQLMQIA